MREHEGGVQRLHEVYVQLRGRRRVLHRKRPGTVQQRDPVQRLLSHGMVRRVRGRRRRGRRGVEQSVLRDRQYRRDARRPQQSGAGQRDDQHGRPLRRECHRRNGRVYERSQRRDR